MRSTGNKWRKKKTWKRELNWKRILSINISIDLIHFIGINAHLCWKRFFRNRIESIQSLRELKMFQLPQNKNTTRVNKGIINTRNENTHREREKERENEHCERKRANTLIDGSISGTQSAKVAKEIAYPTGVKLNQCVCNVHSRVIDMGKKQADPPQNSYNAHCL